MGKTFHDLLVAYDTVRGAQFTDDVERREKIAEAQEWILQTMLELLSDKLDTP